MNDMNEASDAIVDEMEEIVEEVPSVKIPKGITQEQYDAAKSIITSGFANEASPDVIKSEIFKLGVPFSKLNPLFNLIAKNEKLIADPREVKYNISNALENVDLNYEEDYETLTALAKDIADEVTGATAQKVLSILKADFKENEAEFPAKPKGTAGAGRMGAVTRAIINLMKTEKKPTRSQVKEAILPHVKGEDNAIYYTNQYHKLVYAVANSMSADEVLSLFAGENG